MNDGDYGQKGYGCVTITVSLIAVACSIFALATADVASNYKNSDCAIITVLGTIVTFLVAWQIWQTVSIKTEMAEFQEKVREEIKKERLTREYGIIFQEALKAKDEGRYSDAIKSMCSIIKSCGLEAFIVSSAINIDIILRNYSSEIEEEDKGEIKESLKEILAVVETCDAACGRIAKTIRNFLNGTDT